MAPPDVNASLHQQMGQLLAGMDALKDSIKRVEEQSRRSEDKSDQSRAVVHKRMDEMVNRVHSVEKTMAVVQEDVAEMKPVTENLRKLEETVSDVKDDVADMKPETDDIKRWKLMGVGGMTVIGFGMMAVGVSFADALKRIAGVIIGK